MKKGKLLSNTEFITRKKRRKSFVFYKIVVSLQLQERDTIEVLFFPKVFFMHTKSQLESMNMDELHDLAQKIGAEHSDDQITLIYNIIDKESEVGSMDIPVESKTKKRGRKTKVEKEVEITKEAENVPSNNNDTTKEETKATAEKSQPKKRGRKSKAATEDIAEITETKEIKESAIEVVDKKQAKEPKKRSRKAKSTDNEQQIVKAENAKAEETVVEVISEDEKVEQPVQEASSTGVRDFKIIQDVRSTSAILEQLQSEQQKEQQKEQSIAEPAPKVPEKTYSFEDKLVAEGVLEMNSENTNGFLRSSDFNYMPSPDDILINTQQIKNYGLKTGDVVRGTINMPARGEKYYSMSTILSINECDPKVIRDRSPFENLTPLFPDEKFKLCSGNNDKLSVRIVDLFAPIGKGQRALIVAQPKTGKTILMKEIANAIAQNHPEAYLMMLLIDERPEEVTDMARTVNAEVIASTFDEPAERHVRIAGIVLEKAKRMVECGHDVVIFLDSITRLARAYNTVTPASGKVLTGGVDANAMHKPKRFFGAARNIEGGGSLTIIATALTDTGSKMDEVIFEEFKGTGNMELQLDRMLANKRIFPAVNIVQSSTRRDDLLQDKMTLDRMWILRKFLADMNAIEAMTEVKERIERTLNNDEFLISMNS